MGERYVEMSGDFDKLDPIIRDEARQELSQFLERHQQHFNMLNLRVHMKRLNASLGNNILVRCSFNLFTSHGRFHVVEEGFGAEAAIKSGLLAMRYQVEKHVQIRMESREKVEGRRAMASA
jgi:hypothetical protein